MLRTLQQVLERGQSADCDLGVIATIDGEVELVLGDGDRPGCLVVSMSPVEALDLASRLLHNVRVCGEAPNRKRDG